MASKAPFVIHHAPRHAPRRRYRAGRRQAAHGPHLEALLTVLPSLPRPALARLVQKAIDRMDQMDGDADLEDAIDLEDDFALTPSALAYFGRGPGCPIADAAGQCDEDGINTNLMQAHPNGPGCPISDPGGGNVEDEEQINEVEPYTGPIATASSRDLANERWAAI